MSIDDPKSTYIEVELPAVTVTRREPTAQERSELAKTFQEEAETLYANIKLDLTGGRVVESERNLSKLLELTKEFAAQPLIDLTQTAIEFADSRSWTYLLNDHLPKIATALQGTVNELRDQKLLLGSVRLPKVPPIDRHE